MPPVGFKALVVGFALLLMASLAHSATIEDEVKNYLNPGETASYQIINSSGQVYYIVSINGELSFIFDSEVSVVTDGAMLKKVLYDYYAAIGRLGFSQASASAIQGDFGTVYSQWENCNYTFYRHIETNFYFSQYKCIDPSVGVVCRESFNERASIDAQFAVLKDSVEKMVSSTNAGDRNGIVDSLSRVEGATKSIQMDIGSFDSHYAYFFGKDMATEEHCLFNSALLSSILSASSSSVRERIVDLDSITSEVTTRINFRLGLSEIVKIRVEGQRVYEKAKKFKDQVVANFSEYGFPTEAIVSKFNKIRGYNNELQNASEFLASTELYSKIEGAFAEMKNKSAEQRELLDSYNEAANALNNASKAIDFITAKYGASDERVDSLSNEYLQVRQELEFKNNDLKNGNPITSSELSGIAANATDLAERAKTLPSKENEVDLVVFSIIAVLVLLTIGGGVYYWKFMEKPPGQHAGHTAEEAEQDEFV